MRTKYSKTEKIEKDETPICEIRTKWEKVSQQKTIANFELKIRKNLSII